jgi:small subunit ribosomal protein S17
VADENTNEEIQDEAAEAAEPEVEATDAPAGVADVENLPVEQVPEGDSPGSAEEQPAAAEPEASAEAAEPEPESAEEPAEGPPADESGEPAEEPAADADPAADESSASAPAAESDPEPAAGLEQDAPDQAAPAAESEPVAEAPAAAPEKKKRKRLPRSQRRQRSKPVRERPAERKPIARLPKPEHERGRRQERQGKVVSATADKTIVVRVDVVKLHPMYKKVVKRSTKLHAHDEENEAKVGDIVRLVETRPLSKLKRWRLQEVVEAAK